MEENKVRVATDFQEDLQLWKVRTGYNSDNTVIGVEDGISLKF